MVIQCLLSTVSVKKRNEKSHRNGTHPDVSILLLLPEGWGSDISSSELDRFSWLPPPFACSVIQFPKDSYFMMQCKKEDTLSAP
jgi:hypothetical protein